MVGLATKSLSDEIVLRSSKSRNLGSEQICIPGWGSEVWITSWGLPKKKGRGDYKVDSGGFALVATEFYRLGMSQNEFSITELLAPCLKASFWIPPAPWPP